jgi:hypothetical protein
MKESMDQIVIMGNNHRTQIVRIVKIRMIIPKKSFNQRSIIRLIKAK